MLTTQTYSRTHRIGELYEEFLYSYLVNKRVTDPPICMNELFIKPKDDPDFSPGSITGGGLTKYANWYSMRPA